MIWTQLDPRVLIEHAVGLIPDFLSTDDPRGACDQLAANYCGGWYDMKVGRGGFTMTDDAKLLMYPGDRPLHALARTQLGDECIVVYESAFVAVIQPDKSFRVSRLD